jgi:hypothetical protein
MTHIDPLVLAIDSGSAILDRSARHGRDLDLSSAVAMTVFEAWW